jgi:hypothetical protein
MKVMVEFDESAKEGLCRHRVVFVCCFCVLSGSLPLSVPIALDVKWPRSALQ